MRRLLKYNHNLVITNLKSLVSKYANNNKRKQLASLEYKYLHGSYSLLFGWRKLQSFGVLSFNNFPYFEISAFILSPTLQ